MEPFKIHLPDATYVVEPQDNGTFSILEGEEKIGVIYPEPGTMGIEWKTMDELEEGFVGQLGALISEHEMGKSNL